MVSIQETIIEQTAIGATIFRQTCKKSLILIYIVINLRSNDYYVELNQKKLLFTA
jgi:hypothetical protein